MMGSISKEIKEMSTDVEKVMLPTQTPMSVSWMVGLKCLFSL